MLVSTKIEMLYTRKRSHRIVYRIWSFLQRVTYFWLHFVLAEASVLLILFRFKVLLKGKEIEIYFQISQLLALRLSTRIADIFIDWFCASIAATAAAVTSRSSRFDSETALVHFLADWNLCRMKCERMWCLDEISEILTGSIMPIVLLQPIMAAWFCRVKLWLRGLSGRAVSVGGSGKVGGLVSDNIERERSNNLGATWSAGSAAKSLRENGLGTRCL